MKRIILPAALVAAATFPVESRAAEGALDPKRLANTIVLNNAGVKNLRIETVPVSRADFESTVFAIGRVREIPARRSVLSSRIPGRAVKVHAFPGDRVEKDQVLVEVESRQPGNPPPVIPLRSPGEGLLIESHVRLGQPVEPDEELLDIVDRSRMWAVAMIPESEAASIEIGTPARIRIPALGGEPIEAKLSRFGIEAGRAAGAVEGIFELNNPEGRLRPGMRTEFSIITASRKGVRSIPRKAVQGDPSKRVVFVKDFELKNAFVRTPVVLGEQNDRFVEVISGLFPVDEVVTRGSYSLSYAGAGSISLKEALDAAHGHEHNEDGSEKTPEQLAAAEAEKNPGGAGGSSKLVTPLLVYGAAVTLLFLAAVGAFVNERKRAAGSAPAAS